MTGIELLQMIKNHEIEEGTEINVLRNNEECCCYDVMAKLKYNDNDLFWSPGTFRSSMLWDDDYLFEINKKTNIQNKIEKLDISALLQTKKWKRDKKTWKKTNELIDAVNYLLNK